MATYFEIMNYSPKELKLIYFFKLEKIATEVAPVLVFQMMFKYALIRSVYSDKNAELEKYIKAAANIALAIDKGINRNTPEWDNLLGDL